MAFWIPQPTWVTELVSSVKLGKMTQGTTHLKERLDGLTPFTNSDVGALAYGDLLVQDAAAGERKFKKSPATPGAAGPFFVCLDAVPIGGTGYAAHIGHVDLSYTGTAPVVGDRLQASSVAGTAMVGTTNPLAVAYANALGSTVQAILFGPGGTAGGGGGGGAGGGLLSFMAPIVPPVLASLTRVNENVSLPYTQVGTTVVMAAGSIEPFPNVRVLAAPSTHTHWHFRAAVLPSVGFGAIDVLLLDSSNAYRCYGARLSGLTSLSVYQWSFVTPTSSDRNVGGTQAFIATTPLWLHAWWDGTTMHVGLSGDGLNPAFIFSSDPASVGWPSGHTPDSFGIGVEGLNTLNPCYASIISWQEIALA